jgi:cellobiose phosphorylase
MPSVHKYGRFIDSESCFELTKEPPRKWRNVHYNRIGPVELYGESSNIGDGPVVIRDNAGITCNLTSWDSNYAYIRDDETNAVFCPWGQPAPLEVTDKSARFYPNVTVISGTCRGLTATERIFCPATHPMMVYTVTVRNNTNKPRKVSIFYYAMFQLTGCDSEGRGVWKDNFSEVRKDIGGVFVTNRNRQLPADNFKGYLVALKGFKGGSGYRDHFTRSDYSLSAPKILYGWNADNRPGVGPDCAAVVQVTLRIAPKKSGRADFLLGQASSLDDVRKVRKQFTEEKLDQLCLEQLAFQRAMARSFTVKTGVKNYDSLMNNFVKHQMYSYLINKSGFRDNLQMDNALCLVDYPVAEANLLRALSSQMPNGQVPHGFRPINRLQYSDKPAWIMLTVPGLVNESGDLSLLEKVVPYFESGDKGTVWDHMLRAMRFLCTDLGKHGLCNQHHADWNDGLEATKETGERESVMVTQQLCYGLLRMEELAKRLGTSDIATEARQQWETFNRRLNDQCWDGEWYVRTVCEDGYRIGSHTNNEGKIFINSQSWAVLSSTGEGERGRICMESLDRLLEADLGWRLCSPPFTEYDPRVGRMSNTMPGASENGGCYCHGAGFKGVADCLLGRPEQAWNTFCKVAPDHARNPLSRSEVEPFSFTNSYTTIKQIYGRSGYPWRTGTAGWMTVLLVEWILGARRSFDGLLIDPCLTKKIKHAEVSRLFRGARYDITLDNSAGRCRGASSIAVDGQKISGNVLPDLRQGEHKVEVII